MAKAAEVVRIRDRRPPPPPEEALDGLPDDDAQLLRLAQELTEICRSNQGQRAAYYRFLSTIVETGRVDGSKSLLNLMFSLLDRLSSMLYSPTDIRFSLDFENDYQKIVNDQAARAARLLARSWERTRRKSRNTVPPSSCRGSSGCTAPTSTTSTSNRCCANRP